MERTSKQIRREEKERKRQAKLTPILSSQMGPKSPPKRWPPTSNQVMAGAAVITVGLSLYTFFGQRQTDAQVKAFQGELKRLSDSAEWMRAAEFAPHPYVVAPAKEIHLTDRGKVIQAANLTIRNIGRGTCYNCSATVVFESNMYMVADKDGNLIPLDKPLLSLGPSYGPVKVCSGLTLGPNEQIPFPFDQYPLLETKGPQQLNGRIEISCVDESRKPRSFIQDFSILIRIKTKNDLTARYYMPSPVSVGGSLPADISPLDRLQQYPDLQDWPKPETK